MAARAMAAVGSEHTQPRLASRARHRSRRSRSPPFAAPTPPPLPSCSGIFSSDTAFKMAAPPPGNPFNRPLQQAPSRRHLVPRPSPPPSIFT